MHFVRYQIGSNSLCPVTDISATVRTIGVKFGMIVDPGLPLGVPPMDHKLPNFDREYLENMSNGS